MAPVTAAPPGRPRSARTLRSASRQPEDVVDVRKPARRSARQATVASDSEQLAARPEANHHPPALATIAEITPQPAMEVSSRSPAALSEMSGTTAIASFSMVEADVLEPRYMLKHLRKLYESVDEFLEHLAPDGADMRTDLRNMTELQKPDSDFIDDYRDYDVELNVHLRHYKSEHHPYIHIRALHRALFIPHGHGAAAQTGLDLILYLANLLIFVKQIIASDRNSKATWNLLRQLDNSFPSHFMPALVTAAEPTAAGESVLWRETYELALELRTQLAIMVLARQDNDAHHDEVIDDVFVRPHPSQTPQRTTVRGWSVLGLEAEEPPLPREFEARVVRRCDELREILGTGDSSPNDKVTFLEEQFPWEPTILRLLYWARLRRRELKAVINRLGGAGAIVRNIQQTREAVETTADDAEVAKIARAAGILQVQPRKKRKSFGRDRRRSSRKFDPNAPIDPRLIDALKARERLSGALVDMQDGRQNQEGDVEPAGEWQPVQEEEQPIEVLERQAIEEIPVEELERQPVEELERQPIEELEEQIVGPALDENENATLVAESPRYLADEELRLPKQRPSKEVQAKIDMPATDGPPKSTADLLSALKAVSNPQKENCPVGLFDRHPTAQRVEFGSGFDDSQPTPGPSNPAEAKRKARPSPRKRSRPSNEEDETETDEFETIERGSRVQQQRQKAPAAKRARINRPSSGAPLSHQPRRRSQSPEPRLTDEQAPDMTEVPAASSYQAQHLLAQQNRLFQTKQRERKAREAWTVQEEEAFIEYMGLYPGKYATILERDNFEGRRILQNRTQVNLKDKARTMAINMIKCVVASC